MNQSWNMIFKQLFIYLLYLYIATWDEPRPIALFYLIAYRIDS